MNDALRFIGGAAYRGKEPIENVYVDKERRDIVVGQRDQTRRSSASILIGKVAERVPATDYFDYNLWLDTQFPHVVFIAGKRGSGKSYDLGVILEGLNASGSNFSNDADGFASILFDLQSQFWTLGQELKQDLASDRAQAAQLEKWNIKGSVRKPQLFLPAGGQEVFGSERQLTIPPRTLDLADWLALLEVSRFDPMGQLMVSAIELTVARKAKFSLSDLVETLDRRAQHFELQSFQDATFEGLRWRLKSIERTNLFVDGELAVESMLQKGACSIVLLRDLPEDLKAVCVAVIMRQVERAMSRHQQRRKIAMRAGTSTSDETPSRVWVMIDEAHLVCPAQNKTSANAVIVDYVKRGRDAGLSLVLATQQPSAIDSAAISQVDVTILHKLTVDADIVAATGRLPSPMPSTMRIRDKDVSDPRSLVRELLLGEALLSDSEASRTFLVRTRPRTSPHGGGEPIL